MFSKAALATVGAVTAITGVAILVMSPSILSQYPTPLSKDSGFPGTDYSSDDKLGGKYKDSLVGMDQGNKKWWEESYAKWQNDSKEGSSLKNQLSDEFKNEDKVKSAYSDSASTEEDKNKALNRVCETAYKKAITEFSSSDTSDNKSKYEENVWRYCSIVGSKPTQ